MVNIILTLSVSNEYQPKANLLDIWRWWLVFRLIYRVRFLCGHFDNGFLVVMTINPLD